MESYYYSILSVDTYSLVTDEGVGVEGKGLGAGKWGEMGVNVGGGGWCRRVVHQKGEWIIS